MRVLITGCTGQDGPYLARQLADAGHEVHGMVRGQQSPKWDELTDMVPEVRLARGDLTDLGSLIWVLEAVRPQVVYNLGALSFVGTSWTQPQAVMDVTGLGCLRMLDAIRHVSPDIRLVQASSSEMFGEVPAWATAQREDTALAPRSPYAVAKVTAHLAVACYRASYGLHASCAIMFNHESPRRGREFVTRKIARAAARIAAGKQAELVLGRLDPRRDWGWAPEYTEALPLIAARDTPGDFVLATGTTHMVADFAAAAFGQAGLDWRRFTRSDPACYRPAEVSYLCGDASRARRELGWEARLPFAEIARRMVIAEMARVQAGEP